MSKTLNDEKVSTIFLDCLIRDVEDKSNVVKAEGILFDVGLHPGRLASHKDEIVIMLDELPDDFRSDGGASFLRLCVDKNGAQWTGLQKTMQELVWLGIGISKVKCVVPREGWTRLPGGLPFYSID